MSAPVVAAPEVRIHQVEIDGLPDGMRPLAPIQVPVITADASAVMVELDLNSPRGPWLVVDLTSGQARVGRRLPQVWGGLLDGARALLGTSGGLIDVDLGSVRIVRELTDGLGKGRDVALDSFLRLDDQNVLVGRRDGSTATLIDLSGWTVQARQIPVAPPWVVLGGSQTRVWSLSQGEVVTLDSSGTVLDRSPAPPALAATMTDGGVVALLGGLRQRRGTGWRHTLGRDLLPGRLQDWLRGPLEDAELALLDPDTLGVVTRRPLRSMTRAVEGTLALLADPEHGWGHGTIGSILSVDVHGRVVVLGDRELLVLDPVTLRTILHERLPGDHWSTRDGVSCAVAIGGQRTLLVVDW